MADVFPPPLKLALGSTLGAALFGVTCVQTFYFFRSATKDGWIMKALVLSLLIFDTLHQCLITHIFYYYCIINYGNPVTLLNSVWSISVRHPVTCLRSRIVVDCKGFGQAEIIVNWKGISPCSSASITLDGTPPASLFSDSGNAILTVAHFRSDTTKAMNLVYPIRGLFTTNLLNTDGERQTGISGLAVAVATDVCISGCLAFWLSKNRTGFRRLVNPRIVQEIPNIFFHSERRSDRLIDKLIAMTVTTGLLTTVFVIANLVAYVVAPNGLYVLCFNFMLGKLYINALLTSLNVRNAIREGQNSESQLINSIPLAQLAIHSGTESSNSKTSPVAVSVDRVVRKASCATFDQTSMDATVHTNSAYKDLKGNPDMAL
ncbi:predicted protein [Postia placenta Mad-698-R]|nr:predicted protein [Postia placenta Mad-698-R]